MFKNKSFIISLLFLPTFFIGMLDAQQRLDSYDFGSASVLPFFFDQDNKKYFILAREVAGKPESKGTYDDFGGSRERNWGPQKNLPEPYFTNAGHEFLEEALLESIGFSLQDTLAFIDINGSYTKYVVAFARNVAYIVDFNEYADTLFSAFYGARNKLKAVLNKLKAQDHTRMTLQEKRKWEQQKKHYWARLEKDSLAIVECEALKSAIISSKRSTGVMVQAQVLNPENLTWKQERITLRPYFVKKLRPFFINAPYHVGENAKIRLYDINPTQSIAANAHNDICEIAPISHSATDIKPSCQKCTMPDSQKPWLTRVWNWIKSYTQ